MQLSTTQTSSRWSSLSSPLEELEQNWRSRKTEAKGPHDGEEGNRTGAMVEREAWKGCDGRRSKPVVINRAQLEAGLGTIIEGKLPMRETGRIGEFTAAWTAIAAKKLRISQQQQSLPVQTHLRGQAIVAWPSLCRCSSELPLTRQLRTWMGCQLSLIRR